MGTNDQLLRQIMGHTTTRTLSRYVKPVAEYQQKAMEDYEKNIFRLFKSGFAGCKVESESTAESTAEKIGKKQKKAGNVANPCKLAS
jgi:hypothetical protein